VLLLHYPLSALVHPLLVLRMALLRHSNLTHAVLLLALSLAACQSPAVKVNKYPYLIKNSKAFNNAEVYLPADSVQLVVAPGANLRPDIYQPADRNRLKAKMNTAIGTGNKPEIDCWTDSTRRRLSPYYQALPDSVKASYFGQILGHFSSPYLCRMSSRDTMLARIRTALATGPAPQPPQPDWAAPVHPPLPEAD
nr:hypothetical protein [Tanacetum cinerariifolium]